MGKAARLNKELNRLNGINKPYDERVLRAPSSWMTDEEWDTMTAKVKLLALLDIEQFFDTTKEFTSENLREWMDTQILPYRKEIKRVLGFSVNDHDPPVAIAQLLLAKLGLKMKCHRTTKNGKTVRSYRLETTDPDNRGEVLARWLKHDLENSATA